MYRGPIAVRIFQPGRDLVPMRGFIRLQRAFSLRFNTKIDTEITDVVDWSAFLCQDLRQRLSRILVIEGDIVIEVGLDGLEHGGPIRPLRWTIVADDVGRPR